MRSMIDAELRLLAALHEATRLGAVRWRVDTDDPERDVYRATVGGEPVEVEFVYVPVGDGKCAELLLVRVSGLGVYFQSAIGTPIYRAAEDMLELQVHGWADGRAGGQRRLAKATARVEALVATIVAPDAESRGVE